MTFEIPSTIQAALQHHQAGRLSEAEVLYRQVLHAEPNNLDALHFLGVLAYQLGQYEQAVNLIGRAIEMEPGYAEAHNNRGLALQKQGRPLEAIAHFERAVALKPNDAGVHNNLGVVLKEQKKFEEAGEHLRWALALKPDYAEAYNNLGTLLQEQAKPEEAAEQYRRALALKPDYAEAHNNLGLAQHEQGRYAEAIIQFQRALELKPDYAEAYCNLANTFHAHDKREQAVRSYQRALRMGLTTPELHKSLGYVLQQLGRFDEAISSHQAAIQIDPEFAAAYIGMASVHKEQGNYPAAIANYQQVLLFLPEDAGVRHMLAAIGGAPMPSTAAPEYVAKLFDEYANRFDKNLVEDLEYRGPQQLNHAVRRAAGPGARQFDVIDLGCGTGLCGPLFRDLARTLVGVDLSPKMIEKTRARQVYDRLMLTDIATALREPGVSYDLILAADVFIYVGELTPVFEACRTALRPNGLFAFTLEEDADGESYTLRTSGRYAHSISYIRKLAQAYEMKEISLDHVMIRKENAKPLPGYIFLLGR